MRKLLLALGLALGLGPAVAQVNFVPQIGVNSANLRQNTYSAAIKKLVPAASSTDFFCINGSASKRVVVNKIEFSGTATTLQTVPVYLNHNLGLDTGTIAVAATYGPVPNPLVSTNPAATATTVAYNTTGGVPTIGGTVTLIRTGNVLLDLPTSLVVGAMDRLVWTFGEQYNQHLSIPAGATTEQFCLNLGTTSVTGGVLEGYIEWTEQ